MVNAINLVKKSFEFNHLAKSQVDWNERFSQHLLKKVTKRRI